MARHTIHVVGLTGYAGSGKDTAAGGLVAVGYQRMAFADGVRELALAVDPWIASQGLSPVPLRLSLLVAKRGWHWAKGFPEVRETLQNIGKGVRDIVGPRAWVDALDRRWRAAGSPDVVVTDVRYPNEAAWVKDRGGMVIRVDRPGIGPVNGHESETLVGAIAADATVVNDGTEAELRDRVAEMVREHYQARPAFMFVSPTATR